ncbi:MAG: phosphoribosylaminoimidazolesuccinocarboxamide synthase, partial [Calditrichia bacterium]
MKKQDIFLEGKTKKLYKTDNTDQLLMEFLDTLPETVNSKDSVKGKGAVNSAISAFMFDYLSSYN